MRAFTKFIQLAGLVAVTSFGALIVVGGLGLAGIGFSASGLVMFVIGVLESADIHPPGVQMNGISPMWAIAFGPVVIFVGLATLAAVRASIRFTVGTWRRVSRGDERYRTRPAEVAPIERRPRESPASAVFISVQPVLDHRG